MKSRKKTLASALKENPELSRILESEGMFCSGCPFAQFETLEEGARLHSVDLKKLKRKIKKKD